MICNTLPTYNTNLFLLFSKCISFFDRGETILIDLLTYLFKSIKTSVSFDLVDAKVNADFNPIFSQVGFLFSFRKNR